MAGREGEDGPECQCNADDRLGTEMVSQPAARNLHDGIADEECADDDAHLRGRKGEVLRNRRKREPDGGPVYIGYTEPYIEEEEYHVLVFTLILFQPTHR